MNALILLASFLACEPSAPIDVRVRIEHIGGAYPFLDSEGLGGDQHARTGVVRGGPSERLQVAVALGDRVVTTPAGGLSFALGDTSDELVVWDVTGGVATPTDEASGLVVMVRPGDRPETGGDLWTIKVRRERGSTPLRGGVAAASRGDFAWTDGEGAAVPGFATVGDDDVLATFLAERSGLTVPLASPVWAIGPEELVMFTEGEAAPPGLEDLAEDGAGGPLAEALAAQEGWTATGTLAGPEGAYEPGPALPGDTFIVRTQARPDDRLHLAWMFAESNDIFFGLEPEGVALFDEEGALMEAELPLVLWNAGTEVDAWPGTGADQAPRQSAPNTGADEGGVVHRQELLFPGAPAEAGFQYPEPSSVVRVTLEAAPAPAEE